MVSELKEVLQKVKQLDSNEQKSIAKMINDELEWENTLNNTQDKLATLAKEAIQEYQSGKQKKKIGSEIRNYRKIQEGNEQFA